jgi:hypothetical protein
LIAEQAIHALALRLLFSRRHLVGPDIAQPISANIGTANRANRGGVKTISEFSNVAIPREGGMMPVMQSGSWRRNA